MNIQNPYRFGTVSSGYILDTYPSKGGYSLRKLITGATVSIRMRRDSDDAETDVLLNDAGTMTLSSFITGGVTTVGTWASTDNCYVTEWYDQVYGTFNATQTTHSEQPQIIAAGVLNLENSLAAIKFGNPTRLNLTAAISPNFSYFAVVKNTSYSIISYLFGYPSSGTATGGTNGTYSSPFTLYGGKQRRGATVRPSGHKLFEWFNDAVYFDDSEDTPYDVSETLLESRFNTIGGRPDIGTLNFQGNCQEIIFYDTNENGGDRQPIHDDISTFYGTT